MEKGKSNKKGSKGKYILIGLGVVAVAGTAYYFATRKPKGGVRDITSFDPVDDFSTTISIPSTSSSSKGSSSGFPLKKGSRGDLVKNLQQALIKKYGSSILPRYGADGDFGGELHSALISKGLPTKIGAGDFTKIVTTANAVSTGTTSKKRITPSLVASNLRLAILDDDFSKANTWLSKMKTVKNYSAVSTEFKKKRIDGVRKTVVNALLTKFWSTSEKKKLNAHFYRMGLKYNGSQWSLSGLGQVLCDQIKSIQNVSVWDDSGRKIKVPKGTILGEFLDAQNNVTKFKTLDGKVLFTSTKSICYV